MPSFHMTWLRPLFLLFLILNTFNVYADEVKTAPVSETPKKAEFLQILKKGVELVQAGKGDEAIQNFDQIINFYENEYKNSASKIYCANDPKIALLYMLEEAAAATKGTAKHHGAVVFSPIWADAYYLKGYVFINQKKIEAAQDTLMRALELSPKNAQFLNELGVVYTIKKQFDLSMEKHKQAEEFALLLPDQQKNAELGRALRRQGYILIEQNRLDEAEKIYRSALELDPNDGKAKHQLGYIEQLRAKRQKSVI